MDIPNDLSITLILPLANVNIMLQSMHQQPYASVATTISAVEQQAQASIQAHIAAQKAKPAEVPPAPAEPKVAKAPNRAARRAKP